MKYEQIMDRIEVTPEMRQRVLRNIETARRRKTRRLTRQLFTLAACLAIVVCCWFAWKPKQAREPEQGLMGAAQIESVESLAALCERTGVPMEELTGIPFPVEHTEYVSYWGDLAEIQYFGGTNTLRYRKSLGTEDNSGDYNAYAREAELVFSGCAVTLKGDADGYTLATWTDGAYACSVSVSEPLSEDVFRSLLEGNLTVQ